jgi:hypothetical protein
MLHAIYNGGMSTAENYAPQNEYEKVIQWRAEQLYAAGCRDIHSGRQLALSDCDIHKACEMLRQGCDSRLVCRILL